MKAQNYTTKVSDLVTQLVEEREVEKEYHRFNLNGSEDLVPISVGDYTAPELQYPHLNLSQKGVGQKSSRNYTRGRHSGTAQGIENLKIEWGLLKILDNRVHPNDFITGSGLTSQGYFRIEGSNGQLFIVTLDFEKSSSVHSLKFGRYWNKLNQDLSLDEAIPRILRNCPVDYKEQESQSVVEHYLRRL